eukprot:COSAG01_NODE_8140_length_2902_cov_56.215889_2_plen_44_part_00
MLVVPVVSRRCGSCYCRCSGIVILHPLFLRETWRASVAHDAAA